MARVPGVERGLLFGSRARGDHRENSDIDLLVVGPRDPQFGGACRTAANIAMQSAYDHHVGIDVVPLEPARFDFMLHGINHIAAKAARNGIATMGHRYKPSPDPVGSGRPEHRRREAMERAWSARSCRNNLEWAYRMEPEVCPEPMAWNIQVGPRTLEVQVYALKAVFAAYGHPYVCRACCRRPGPAFPTRCCIRTWRNCRGLPAALPMGTPTWTSVPNRC